MPAIYHEGVVTTIPHYNIGSGRDAVNVLNWQTTLTGLTTADLTAIQTAFDNAWSAGWRVEGTSGVAYIGSWVIDNSGPTGGQVTNVGYVPVAGSKAGGALSDNSAGLISVHGSTRYRGGHSRIYIPGLDATATALDGRNLTPAAVTALTNLWNNTATAMSGISSTDGGPLLPVIWHKKGDETTLGLEAVSGITVQQVLATQRRRLRKVSRHKTHTATP